MSGYRGRFAPSPTGPLHFGSLVAAAASYLDARSHNGEWLVRMEDVDEPRSQPGAADDILRTLEAFGFEWDGTVLYQSAREEAYRAALEELKKVGVAYPCGCSRREIGGDNGNVYPGTCRNGLPPHRGGRSWRVRVPDAIACFQDRLQGRFCHHLAREVGDFVLLRADGYFAYQLAVVVDDAGQGVTDVVRGVDLIDSTPRQMHLQRLLGYGKPRYLHVPVAVNERGEKLSKQTLAPSVDAESALPTLGAVLVFLGQAVPEEPVSVRDFWTRAIAQWQPERLPPVPSLPAPPL
jgi:glutamyl-Q tRNA(Asp) synthetase